MAKTKEKVRTRQAVSKADPDTARRDVLALFGAAVILTFILQKLQLYIDWDTLESVIKMNAAGYSPLTNPPSHYHFLVEPLVYVITVLASPILGSDQLNGYILMTSLFAGGLLALTYFTVRQVTGDRGAAWLSAAFVGVSYNFLFLSMSSEDNIINQFFNLLTIFLVIVLLGVVKTRLDQKTILAAFVLSLGLAVGTNLRSLYLLALLPLVVILAGDRIEGLKKASYAAVGFVLVVVSMALCSLALAKKAITLDGLAGFFRVDYYSDPGLWFFAGSSRDLVEELFLASKGFTRSLFGDYLWSTLNGVSPWLIVLAAALSLAILGVVLLRLWREPVIIVLVGLFLLNTANSFFYEAGSLERWDHAVLLLGLLAGVAWAKKPQNLAKYALLALVGLAALGTLLFVLTAGSLITFTAFSYEKIPSAEFRDHTGLVVTGQEAMTEQTMYLRYLYGSENVVFYNDTVPAQDILTYLERANRTVYYDAMIYNRCANLSDGDEFLAGSRMLGTFDLPWYVYPG